MAQGNQCSFLLNIYYLHVTSKLEFDDFVSKFDRNDLSYSTWHKKRKLIRSSLLTRSSYKNGSKDGEDKQFVSYFTLEKFSLLTADRRAAHRLRNCLACFNNHKEQFLLLRKNTQAKPMKPTEERLPTANPGVKILDKTPDSFFNKTACIEYGKNVAAEFNSLMEKTPFNITLQEVLKRKAQNEKDVSKKVKRKIIKDARDKAAKEQIDNDFIALYSSTQSARQWDVQRIDSHTVKRPTIKKSHVGKLCSYIWNNNVLLSALETQSANIKNWTQLAKDIELRRVTSNSFPHNAGQVSNFCNYL